MKILSRLLCVVLCCVILTGCGSTAQPATEPTVDEAASFLDMAQSFVDQKDYDGAIAVLEQAIMHLDDPRLHAMLEEVKALWGTPLTVEYSLVSTSLAAEELVIHNITAVHLHSSQVRYAVTYSAPEDMQPQLWGRNLFHAFHGETAGGLETVTFEIASTDVRKMSGQFQLAFTVPELHQVVFDVYTLWPGEEREYIAEVTEETGFSSFELCYWYQDIYENAGFQVNSFRVHDDGENCHFTLDYTAEKTLAVDGYIGIDSDEKHLWTKEIMVGDNTLEFSVSNEDIAQNAFLAVILKGENGEAVDMSLDLPLKMLHTYGNPVGEPMELGYTLRNNWNSSAYQIHSLTAMELDNGYIRYALDMTLPKDAYFTVTNFDRQYNGNTVFSTTTAAGRRTFYMDIPKEQFAQSVETTILLCEVVSRYQNLIIIPSGWFTALTDGTPISDPVWLTWSADGAQGYLGKSFSVQALDNDHYRFTMEFTAPDGQICSVFDPPNGDNVKQRWLLDASQTDYTIAFDVSKDTLEAVTELTMYVDPFEKLTVSIVDIQEAVGSTAVPVEVTMVSWEKESAE